MSHDEPTQKIFYWIRVRTLFHRRIPFTGLEVTVLLVPAYVGIGIRLHVQPRRQFEVVLPWLTLYVDPVVSS